MIPPDIVANDLYYAYPPLRSDAPPTPVLDGVSFTVQRGEFVALLGRVGAGKTTLCLTMNGLAPHVTGGTFRGHVTVLDRDTREHSVADMARYVGMVFQDPENQLVQMRVEEEVAFGPENLGIPSEEIERRVTWALEAVGLAGYRGRSPLLLSGGEKQRVAIASMLAMQSPVLVLDEPTASLDPAGKLAVFNVLAQLRRDRRITIFMATQELDRVARFADRILVLHDGKIALDGSPQEVFEQSARLREWGLGVPQLVELSDKLSARTGRVFRFAGMADAYQQLLRKARKAQQKGIEPHPVALPGPRQNPLSDRAQIVVDRLGHVFADGTTALREVSLTIHPGDFVALLGANGAGKTTLAKHLNGLLKPSSGSVTVEHIDTRTGDVAALARLVGFSFQNPDHQIFAATVEEEIAFGPRVQELPAELTAQYVAEALARFQLGPLAHLPPAVLGFGQRRQVALAATLAPQPRILILDEPTGGLDAQSRREFLRILTDLNAQGRTILLITHDMRIVAEHASRAIVLAGGTVLFDGEPRALFRQAELLRLSGLTLPPVTRLAHRLKHVGLTPDVLTVDEFVRAWSGLMVEPEDKPQKVKRHPDGDSAHKAGSNAG